jgi:hypothetical protein
MSNNSEAVKLMKLAKKAVTLRESSDNDFNEIIAGIAKEASLNSEEVSRVVEWTNTIKMLSLYKSGSDKTTEFDLADPKKINSLIHKEAEAVLDDFDYIITKEAMHKLTDDRSRDFPKMPTSSYRQERAPIIKKAYAKLKHVERRAEESKMRSYSEKTKFLSKMAELSSNLNSHYSESFSDFETNARSIYGDTCLPYMNMLEKMARNNNTRVLNFRQKNVTKNTENSELLKEAMVASKAHHVFLNTAKAFDNLHQDFKTKVEGTLR